MLQLLGAALLLASIWISETGVSNAKENANISLERVDTDEAITMEDCVEIDKKLDMNKI